MLLRKIYLFLMMGLIVGPAGGQPLKVLTCNIRYDNPADGQNAWPLRRTWLCKQIMSAGPGIFGIQEGLTHQVDFIDSSLAGFSHIGVGRDDGLRKGEFSAIFYDNRKFKILKQSTFWLSSTPRKPSVGWDAACIRICTFGLFRELSSGQKFWVFNTHFDHIGKVAREKSAVLIIKKISELNKQLLPVILMGDFNGGPESEPIKIITRQFRDSKNSDKRMSMGPEGTFNGFDATKPVTDRIDFIFTGYGAGTGNYFVIRESHEGRYASDHFPVVAEIRFEHLKKP